MVQGGEKEEEQRSSPSEPRRKIVGIDEDVTDADDADADAEKHNAIVRKTVIDEKIGKKTIVSVANFF